MKEKGFSVLELLVVIAIVAILAGLAIPRFNTSTADRDLDIAARQLAGDMRWMQQNAVNLIAGVTSVNIPFDPQPSLNFYTLAPYGYYIKVNGVVIKQYYFPGAVKTSGYYSAIVFGINGYVNNTFGTTVTLLNGSKMRSVIVDAAGRIRIE